RSYRFTETLVKRAGCREPRRAAYRLCGAFVNAVIEEERMSIFLTGKTSKSRLREAENAQRNRRELIKWGLFTAGGVIAMKNGLSPFVGSAWADSIPTGLPPSPLFGVQDFSTPMPRF